MWVYQGVDRVYQAGEESGSYLKDNYGYETGSSSVHERENKNKKKTNFETNSKKGRKKEKKEKKKQTNETNSKKGKGEKERRKKEKTNDSSTKKRLLEETDKGRDAKDVITSSLSFIFYYASANLFVRTGQQPESHQPLFIFYTQ